MENGKDIMVLFEQIKDIPYQIITNVVWYKDQFAGTMMRHLIYGVMYGENISATYYLPEGRIIVVFQRHFERPSEKDVTK